MMTFALIVSAGFNIALFIAYVLLDLQYKKDKLVWRKKEASWENDKELAVQAVHLQWKSYVDQIRPPGQA